MNTDHSPQPVARNDAPCVLGIDPGVTGALAFYDPAQAGAIRVEDMPLVAGEVDPHALARLIEEMRPAFAVIEKQSPQPRDGVKQAFGLGSAYAVTRTVIALARVPLHVIGSHLWKRHHKVLAATDPKEAGRAVALRLFPASAQHFALKKHHNRSDAALIARFGADTING